jgi:hypothetical protein
VPAVVTYSLTHQCGPARPWTLNCTTSYSVLNHEPVLCRETPPTTICVIPRLPTQILICEAAGWEVTLPPVLVAVTGNVDCNCSSPPTVQLGLVDETGLYPGEVAAWQSGRFNWYNGDERCASGMSQASPWDGSYRVSLSGGGSCYSAQLLAQWWVPPNWCDNPLEYLMAKVIATIPIVTPEDITQLSGSGYVDGLDMPGCGALAPPYTSHPCGYKAVFPFVGWNDPAVYPDHYLAVTVSVPEA